MRKIICNNCKEDYTYRPTTCPLCGGSGFSRKAPSTFRKFLRRSTRSRRTAKTTSMATAIDVVYTEFRNSKYYCIEKYRINTVP